jgi:polysaccharide export outer membrane protein
VFATLGSVDGSSRSRHCCALRRVIASIWLFAVVVSGGSCGLVGNTVQTKVTPDPSTDPTPYIIGSDDVLDVIVWKEPQLSGRLLVAADGTVTSPLIGPVPAAGHTCEQLQKEFREKLSQFTRSPNVTVRVAEAKSRVYYVLGEVRKPGSFPLHSGELLSQGLAEAGGLSEFANPGAVRVVRHSGTEDVQMSINYNRVLSGKDMTGDVPLQAGDTITVP